MRWMPTVGREREVHQHAAARAAGTTGAGCEKASCQRAYRRAPGSTGEDLRATCRPSGDWVSPCLGHIRCPAASVPGSLQCPLLSQRRSSRARACYRLTCCACLPQPFVFPQHCPDRRRLLGLTPGCYRCRCVCAFAHRPSHPSISIDHPVTLSLSPPPPLSSRVCVYAVLRSRRGEVG
jgi:hypothetical protein